MLSTWLRFKLESSGYIRDSCPNGTLSGGVWFTVREEVTLDKRVNNYLNDDLLASLTARFDTRGHGGVLVANGFSNVITFVQKHLHNSN